MNTETLEHRAAGHRTNRSRAGQRQDQCEHQGPLLQQQVSFNISHAHEQRGWKGEPQRKFAEAATRSVCDSHAYLPASLGFSAADGCRSWTCISLASALWSAPVATVQAAFRFRRHSSDGVAGAIAGADPGAGSTFGQGVTGRRHTVPNTGGWHRLRCVGKRPGRRTFRSTSRRQPLLYPSTPRPNRAGAVLLTGALPRDYAGASPLPSAYARCSLQALRRRPNLAKCPAGA